MKTLLHTVRRRLLLATRTGANLQRADRLFARVGLRIEPYGEHWDRHPTADFPDAWQEIIGRVAPYTLTPAVRVAAVIQSVEHVVANEIPGAVVECGVWRGGSMMAAALALLQTANRPDLYLFDTFAGMTRPTEVDVDYLDQTVWFDPNNPGAEASLAEVQAAMAATGYPVDRVRFVEGRVEDTVPRAAPDEIAILRLDTDWYESTKHELEHLWPRLRAGGVLIIDDYGHFAGARKAVDEFFGRSVFLHRLDYTGRLVIKP